MANTGQVQRAPSVMDGIMAMARAITASRLPWFLPKAMGPLTKDNFVYTADWVANTVLTAGGTVTVPIQIQADSYFELVQLNGNVASTDNTTTPSVANPPITIQITDTGSGRTMFASPTLWGNVVGTAQLPGFMPFPKLFAPSSTVNVTLVNLDGANARNVRLAMIGFKVFGYTGTVSGS